MLQGILQYASGPPPREQSLDTQSSASNSFFHVFAAQMNGYDSRRERSTTPFIVQKKPKLRESEESLLELYQKEFRTGGLQSWK